MEGATLNLAAEGEIDFTTHTMDVKCWLRPSRRSSSS